MSTFGPRNSVVMSSRLQVAPSSAGLSAQGAHFNGCSDSGMEKLIWGRGGPVWKTARPGLCIEGVCGSPTCIAYGKTVIHNAGFTSLDLMNSKDCCKCPCCQRTIIPATAAFNNCRWKISGTKCDSPGAAVEKVKMEEWAVAGNVYERFKDDPEDKTVWTKLVITTRPPSKDKNTGPDKKPAKKRERSDKETDPNLVECSICCSEPLSRFGPTAINTPCGHCFHRECLKPWVLGGQSGCPTCRRNISCLEKELQK